MAPSHPLSLSLSFSCGACWRCLIRSVLHFLKQRIPRFSPIAN